MERVGLNEFFQGLKNNMPREDLDSLRAKIPLMKVKKMERFDLMSWVHANMLQVANSGDPLDLTCYLTKGLKAQYDAFTKTRPRQEAPEPHHDNDDAGEKEEPSTPLLQQSHVINITPLEDQMEINQGALSDDELL